MPNVVHKLNKGAFQNVDAFELTNPEFAVAMDNMLIDDAGANIGRPGLLVDSSISIGLVTAGTEVHDPPVIGLFTDFGNAYNDSVAGFLVIVWDNRIVTFMTSANVTASEDLPGIKRPVFAFDGTNVIIAGGEGLKQFSSLGSAVTLTGDPEATHIVYLDGYWLAFEPDTDQIFFAGPTLATRSTWDVDDFFSAEGLGDSLSSLIVLQRELYAIGKKSTEIWQSFGNTTVPFQRSFFVDKGTSAPYSVVHNSLAVYMLDEERRFVRFDAKVPTIISRKSVV